MKGLYLASCKARHYNYDIVYNDIERWLNQVVNNVYDKPVQTNIFDFIDK